MKQYLLDFFVGRILFLADFFLPADVRNRQMVFRTRTMIFVLLVSATMLSYVLALRLLANPVLDQQKVALGVYILIQVACLFGIKLTKRSEAIAAGYLFFVLAVTTFDVAYVNTSPFYSGLVWFPITLLVTFVAISDRRKRLFLILSSLLFTVLCFYITYKNGNVDHSRSDVDTYVTNLYFSHLYKIIITAAFMFSYVAIKNIAQLELRNDLNLRLGSAKLDEINTLVQKLVPALADPLLDLRSDLEILATSNEKEASRENRIRDNLTFMTEISLGISLLYRACRNDQIIFINTDSLLKHMQVLFTRTASSSGWSIRCDGPSPPLSLEGPIPQVLLFLLFLVNDISSRPTVVEGSQILIKLVPAGPDLKGFFELMWNGLPDEPVKEMRTNDRDMNSFDHWADVRETLFENLAETASFEISTRHEAEWTSIKIAGPWFLKPLSLIECK